MDLDVALWTLLLVGAFLVGVAKTSVGGLAVVAVLTFALAMPTLQSTGAVLLVFLTGDLVAIWRYLRDCDWSLLRGLLPWVLPGVAMGAWFLTVVDGVALKRWIGAILAVSVLLHVVLTRRTGERAAPGSGRRRLLGTAGAGLAAGFTTMAANAGGPVMTLYLLMQRVDKRVFVGTGAWFFFIINATKVPFSVAVGAINVEVVKIVAVLAPAVLAGAFVGIWLLRIIPQKLFNGLALLASAVAAVVLMVA